MRDVHDRRARVFLTLRADEGAKFPGDVAIESREDTRVFFGFDGVDLGCVGVWGSCAR